MSSIETMRLDVERRMRRGERFTDVEDVINGSDLTADEKSALWLPGWHQTARGASGSSGMGAGGRRRMLGVRNLALCAARPGGSASAHRDRAAARDRRPVEVGPHEARPRSALRRRPAYP